MEIEAEKLVSQFWEAYEKEDWNDCDKIITELLSQFPDFGISYYCKGHYLLLKKEYENAFDAFTIALDKQSDEKLKAYVAFWIGQIYGTWGYPEKNPLYDSSKAEKYYIDAVSYEDYPIQVIFQLHTHFNVNPEFGIKTIQNAIKKFPDYDSLYILLAKLFKEKYSNNQKYLDLLFKANSREDKSVDSLILIGDYYYEQKEYDKCKIYYQEASYIIKEDEDIEGYLYFQLASANFNLSDYENAEKCYLLSHKNFQNTDLVNITLAVFFAQINKYENAKDLIENLDIEYWEFIMLSQPQRLISLHFFTEIKFPFDYTDSVNILEKIDAANNQRLVGKIALLKAIFWGYQKQYENQVKELKSVLSIFSYDYLIENTCAALKNWLEYILANEKELSNFSQLLYFFLGNEKIKKSFSEYYLDDTIKLLFEKGHYKEICSLYPYFSDEDFLNESTTCFQLAFCLNHIGEKEKSKEIYLSYLEEYEDNSAVLNNLALIYEGEGDSSNAKTMLERAIKLDPSNKKALSNLDRLTTNEKKLIKEKEIIEKNDVEYKEAAQRLVSENDYVLEKLNNLIKNVQESPDFVDGKIPLPEWRIPVFMNTTKDKALSLKEQFILKKYIIKTKQRNSYNTFYYEINPYILHDIKDVLSQRNKKVDKKWIESFQNITVERLEKINYFELLEKISKFNKKFKPFIERDFKELCINYLMGNAKATVVLSGSLVELLLIYICERKKISTITYSNPKSMKSVSEKLYDCDLFGLIIYADDNKLLGKDFPYLGHLLRVYRNLIHPGCELRQDQGMIDDSKIEISFKGAVEILNRIQ